MEQGRNGLRDGQGFYDYAGVDVDAYRMQRLEQLRDRLALWACCALRLGAERGRRRRAGRLTGDRPADRLAAPAAATAPRACSTASRLQRVQHLIGQAHAIGVGIVAVGQITMPIRRPGTKGDVGAEAIVAPVLLIQASARGASGGRSARTSCVSKATVLELPSSTVSSGAG